MKKNGDKVSRFSPKFSLVKQDDSVGMCVLCAIVNYKVHTKGQKKYTATIQNSGVDAFSVTQYLFNRGILIDTQTIFETLFELYLKNVVRQLKNEKTGEILYQAIPIHTSDKIGVNRSRCVGINSNTKRRQLSRQRTSHV